MVGGAPPAGFRFLHLDDAGLARNLGSGETEILGSSSTTFCRMHTVSVVVVVVVVERFRCFAFLVHLAERLGDAFQRRDTKVAVPIKRTL
jgi:hypothetical protein